MEDLKTKELPKIYVESISDNEDGSANVQLNCSDEFIEWFIKDNKLEEWDQELFQKWFEEAITETIKTMEDSTKNEKNPDFVWSQPELKNE